MDSPSGRGVRRRLADFDCDEPLVMTCGNSTVFTFTFPILSGKHGLLPFRLENLVPATGLEPVRCYSLEPESSASANSATRALQVDLAEPDRPSATEG